MKRASNCGRSCYYTPNGFNRRMKGVFNSASVTGGTEVLLRTEQRLLYGRNRGSIENGSLRYTAPNEHNVHKRRSISDRKRIAKRRCLFACFGSLRRPSKQGVFTVI